MHSCPVDVTVLTLMYSRAAMVLWASSNSELSSDTRFRRYFLSLLRLSDYTHTHTHTVCEYIETRHLLRLFWPCLLISMHVFSPLYEGVPPAGCLPAWSQCGSLGGYKTNRTIKERRRNHKTVMPWDLLVFFPQTPFWHLPSKGSCLAGYWQAQTLSLNM